MEETAQQAPLHRGLALEDDSEIPPEEDRGERAPRHEEQEERAPEDGGQPEGRRITDQVGDAPDSGRDGRRRRSRSCTRGRSRTTPTASRRASPSVPPAARSKRTFVVRREGATASVGSSSSTTRTAEPQPPDGRFRRHESGPRRRSRASSGSTPLRVTRKRCRCHELPPFVRGADPPLVGHRPRRRARGHDVGSFTARQAPVYEATTIVFTAPSWSPNRRNSSTSSTCCPTGRCCRPLPISPARDFQPPRRPDDRRGRAGQLGLLGAGTSVAVDDGAVPVGGLPDPRNRPDARWPPARRSAGRRHRAVPRHRSRESARRSTDEPADPT